MLNLKQTKMKTVKKIVLVSFLMGSMLTSVLLTQGKIVKSGDSKSNYITNKPYISAGADISICKGSAFVLQGINTFKDGITIWKTNGDGVFSDIYSLNAVYTPGKHDIANGSVALSLVYLPNADTPTSQPIEDNMVITFGNCSTSGEIKAM
jgi:hypothetical protein